MAEVPASKDTVPSRKHEFADYQHPDDASFDKFVSALDRAYHRPFMMMWRGFLYGIALALGTTIGAGIVLTLLFYVLKTIDFAPYVKDLQELVIPEEIRNQLEKESSSEDPNQVQIITQDPVIQQRIKELQAAQH